MVTSLEPPVLNEADAVFIQGRVIIGIGSRDAANQPSLMRSIGCRVSVDIRRVTVFVTTAHSAALLRDLRAGASIAAVFTRPSTHQTVQLKGEDVTVEPLNSGDIQALEIAREVLTAELIQLGYDRPFVAAVLPCNPEHMTAVTFTPTSAFMQTPGPGAGRRLGA